MAKKNETPETSENTGGGDQPQQPQEGQQEQLGEVSKDARTWAMLCHLLAIFTGFIAPLIIWLIKKDEDTFVNSHGKEALNFQITVVIAMFVSGLLSFICVGFFLGAAVWIVDLIFCIIATMKANSGELYRYPVSIRFIK